MIQKRMVGNDKATIALINKRLDDPTRFRALNDLYHTEKGDRWVDRLRAWGEWLWKHREAIMRILGLVIMFADDGSERIVAEEDVPKKRKPRAKKVEVNTVHGVTEEVTVPNYNITGK